MYADLFVAEHLARQRADDLARRSRLAHLRAGPEPPRRARRTAALGALAPFFTAGAPPHGRHAARPIAAH